MRHGTPGGPRETVWWSGGLDECRPRPLVLVVGGAFVRREEYLPLFARLVRRGHAVVAAVPADPAGYVARSAGLVSRLVDAYVRTAATARTQVIGLDLGGRLALGAAATDTRIAAVHLVGAPVARLFAEADRPFALPPATTGRLARSVGADRRARLPALLGGLELRPEELYDVRARVRVGYAVDDPLTPPQDLALLRLTLKDAEFRAFRSRGGATPAGRPVHRWLASGTRAGR
ncbi:hypothetical protein OG233_05770 [Streptomyces sp. NBC_01218]|uniref:alpha/beta fold hydrolase n=1 Tax=unclassified Streptomyces TaxID=2593676 RepID=UPI002E0D11AC|nr:hypothetical protein OG233_05770 [Streptomyces sp. NBC_01218]